MKALILMACLMCLMFAGCTTTNCQMAQKTLASAQAAYLVAQQSGQVEVIEKYKWTLDATQAVVSIWCSEAPLSK